MKIWVIRWPYFSHGSIRVRRTTLALLLLVSQWIIPAFAQILPPQTAYEKMIAHKCWDVADARTGDIFTYPLRVGIGAGWKSLGVYVQPHNWQSLPRRERVFLMENIACAYAGGRTDKRYWYSFSVGDAATNKVIETFPAAELWQRRFRKSDTSGRKVEGSR